MADLVILRNSEPAPSTEGPDTGPPVRIHLLPGDPPLMFVVEGSRLFEMTTEFFEDFLEDAESAEREFMALMPSQLRDRGTIPLPLPNAISLNVAHSCNLSCSYCYADEGRFGGGRTSMSQEVAAKSIDQLVDANRGQRVTIGFIGGEPFLNRDLIHWAVSYATKRARETGTRVGFSITTNGTLLNPDDLDLLRRHEFAVSVSLDGAPDLNDRERRMRNGGSVFESCIERLRPLLDSPGRAKVTARSTITRLDMRVLERISALYEAGFAEVGVSPLRTSPTANLALQPQDWPILLREMIRAAEAELSELAGGRDLRFSNLAIAMKQLHAGYCKPLPCGSAASYVSVSARGEYFTCHRTIDDARYLLGDVSRGLISDSREAFLRSRHVDVQQPCRGCWARYLCGGGCHAEVLSSGRSGCDYIRGWMEYCLRTYNRLLVENPSIFEERI